jgi:hypothetical protein
LFCCFVFFKIKENIFFVIIIFSITINYIHIN